MHDSEHTRWLSIGREKIYRLPRRWWIHGHGLPEQSRFQPLHGPLWLQRRSGHRVRIATLSRRLDVHRIHRFDFSVSVLTRLCGRSVRESARCMWHATVRATRSMSHDAVGQSHFLLLHVLWRASVWVEVRARSVGKQSVQCWSSRGLFFDSSKRITLCAMRRAYNVLEVLRATFGIQCWA